MPASHQINRHSPSPLSSHWRLMVSLLLGASIGVAFYFVQSLSLSTCFLIAWDSTVICYIASIIYMMQSDTLHQHLTQEHEGKALILTLVLLASLVCLFSLNRQTHIGKDYQGLAQSLNLALTIGTIFLAWLMIQVIFALQYAYLYFSARNNKTPAPLVFPEDNDSTEVTSQVEFADFFYIAVAIGTSGQTADVPFTSTAGRKLGTLHCIIAFIFNLAIISLLVSIIAEHL